MHSYWYLFVILTILRIQPLSAQESEILQTNPNKIAWSNDVKVFNGPASNPTITRSLTNPSLLFAFYKVSNAIDIRRSIDSGENWSLFGSISNATEAKLVATPNNLFFAYVKNGWIYLGRSDLGQFVSTGIEIDHTNKQDWMVHAVTDAKEYPNDPWIYIVWSRIVDNGDYDIRFVAVDQNFSIKKGPETIAGGGIGESWGAWYPKIAFGNNTLHVVYQRRENNNTKIFYVRGTNARGSGSWPSQEISGGIPNNEPDVSAYQQRVFTIWRGPNNINHRFSTDSGATLSDIKSPSISTVIAPKAALTEGLWNFACLKGGEGILQYNSTNPSSNTSWNKLNISDPTTPISEEIDILSKEQDNDIAVVWKGGDGAIYFDASWRQSKPDLVITSGSPSVSPTEVASGGMIQVSSGIVKNQGNAGTGGFIIGFYLSSDQNITINDTNLGLVVNQQGLAPNGEYSWPEQTLEIPDDTTPGGPYYIGVFVDRTNTVLESNENNNTVFSSPINVVTLPSVPSNLAATAVSSSRIDLSWQDNSNNEDGFKIERKTGAGSFVQIDQVGPNQTTYSNTGLTASTTYTYRVRAFNSAGNSGYSNEASATTLSIPQPPAAPSNLAATAVSSSQINLTWQDNSNNEDGFKIERKTGAGSFVQIDQVGPNQTTYSNTGLTASTTYTYRVRAFNSAGNSGYSNEASATTLSIPQPPVTPSNLAATAVSSSRIDLSWQDNSNNEDGFKIERKTSAGSFVQIDQVGPNQTTYSNTGLTASTTYTYRVRAFNSEGNSGYSNENSATTQETTGTSKETYAYPNPFNPDRSAIQIVYSLKTAANSTTIKIFDARGDLLQEWSLSQPQQPNTEYKLSWDGRNRNGDMVVNGVYFYRVNTNSGELLTGTIAVLR